MTTSNNTPSQAAVKYKTFKNTAELDTYVAGTLADAQKLKIRVQIALVGTAIEIQKHGDWPRANKFIKALGNGLNNNAIVEWCSEYMGLTIDDGAQEFTGWQGADYIKENFEKAKSVMWFDLKKQNPWKGFDLDAELDKLLKKAAAAQAKLAKDSGLENVVVIDTAKLNKVKLLAGKAA